MKEIYWYLIPIILLSGAIIYAFITYLNED